MYIIYIYMYIIYIYINLYTVLVVRGERLPKRRRPCRGVLTVKHEINAQLERPNKSSLAMPSHAKQCQAMPSNAKQVCDWRGCVLAGIRDFLL